MEMKLSHLSETLIGSEIVKLGGEIREKIRQGEKIYNYTIGDFDPAIFPIPKELEDAIIEELGSVGLAEAIDKMPSELSGGMRKRIGLARTLILKPEIILYDEPTTGLDTITSREISELILAIQKKNKTTSIIITHDMACAKLTGDRLIILKDGVIDAEGSYEELEKSDDEWVRSFFI